MTKSASRRPSAPDGDSHNWHAPTPSPSTPARFTSRYLGDDRTLARCLRDPFSATDPTTWRAVWALCNSHSGDQVSDGDISWLAFHHWPVVGYSFHVYTGDPYLPICARILEATEPFQQLSHRLRQLDPPRALSAWTDWCLQQAADSGLLLTPAEPPKRRAVRPASQASSQASSQPSTTTSTSPTSNPPTKRRRRQEQAASGSSTDKGACRQQDLPTQPEELTTTPHDAYFDGAASHNRKSANPLPGGAGFVVYSPGKPRAELLAGSEPVAAPCTNNVAEFKGLIHLLTEARRSGVRHLRVHGDSKLVVSVMKGSICLRSKTLRPLYKQAKALLRGYDAVAFVHVYRHLNPRADQLAKNAKEAAQKANPRAHLPARTATSGPNTWPPQPPGAPTLLASSSQVVHSLEDALGKRATGSTFADTKAVERFLFSKLKHVQLASADWDACQPLAKWVHRELFTPVPPRQSSSSSKVYLRAEDFPTWWVTLCNEIFAHRSADLSPDACNTGQQPRPRVRSEVHVPPPNPRVRSEVHVPPTQHNQQQSQPRERHQRQQQQQRPRQQPPTTTQHQQQQQQQQLQQQQPRQQQQPQQQQQQQQLQEQQPLPRPREPTRVLVLQAWPDEVPTSTDAALLLDLEAHGLPIHPDTEVIRGGPGGQIALRCPSFAAAEDVLRDKKRCLNASQYWLVPFRQHSNTSADRKAWVAAFRRHSGDEWGGPQAS